MPYINDAIPKSKPTITCPICGEVFEDIHTFSSHVTSHSQEEKKRKAEEEKKERENQRKKDIDNLLNLKAEYKTAEKKLQSALDEYEKKYGLVFPYTNDIEMSNGIKELLHFFGF